MMIYVFLAQGFEEIEAISVVDVLRRASCEVKTVAVGSDNFVVGANKIKVVADLKKEDMDLSKVSGVVLPGGMPGAVNLLNSPEVLNAIRHCHENKKLIAAICAAPMILGKLNLLEGKKATCYPGFEKELLNSQISDERVCTDGNIITAKGPGVAVEFALKITEYVVGKNEADVVKSSMLCKD